MQSSILSSDSPLSNDVLRLCSISIKTNEHKRTMQLYKKLDDGDKKQCIENISRAAEQNSFDLHSLMDGEKLDDKIIRDFMNNISGNAVQRNVSGKQCQKGHVKETSLQKGVF